MNTTTQGWLTEIEFGVSRVMLLSVVQVALLAAILWRVW